MKRLLLLLIGIMVFSITICKLEEKTDSTFSFRQRYIAIPAWVSPGDDTIEVPEIIMTSIRNVVNNSDTGFLKVIFSTQEENINYYTIYLGHIDNVPIDSSSMMSFDGISNQTITRTQGIINESTVSTSVSKAIIETTSSTSTLVLSASVNAEFKIPFFSAAANTSVKNTITNSHSKTISVSDTYTTALTMANSTTDSFSWTLSKKSHPKGRYRITLFATTDVFLSVKLNNDNSVLLDSEITVCARPSSYIYALDYDPDMNGEFRKSAPGNILAIPEDFSKLSIQPKIFLAVGQIGKMAYSYNGINWTQITVGLNHWNNIAYGNNKWIAVGNSGSMAYSNNGIDWTQINIGSTDWNDVFYGNNKWVAVGNTGVMAYSDQGINWTQITLGTLNFNGVSYYGDQWVAVGANGRFAYSNNGIKWMNNYQRNAL